MTSILLDLEGTIVETIYQRSRDIVNELNSNTKKILIELEIPKNILYEVNRSAILRNKAYRWINNLPNSNNEYKTLYKNIENFLEPFDIKSANSAVLYPETIKILNYLKNQSYKIAIITNTSKKAANIIINKLHLKKYFYTLVTRNDVMYVKPDPEMVLKAIKILNNNPSWLIGDSTLDAEVALQTKIPSIIIRRNNKEINVYCNHIISSLNELLQYL